MKDKSEGQSRRQQIFLIYIFDWSAPYSTIDVAEASTKLSRSCSIKHMSEGRHSQLRNASETCRVPCEHGDGCLISTGEDEAVMFWRVGE